MVGNALADSSDRFGGEFEQGARARFAQLIQQRLFAQRIAGEHETAVAPGCTKTDLFALQQHDVAHAALGQSKRGVQPRKTTTDDGDPCMRAPLASGHLAEDMQLGVRLARDGTPPLFCEDVLVTSVFAASQEGERSQRTRWEHGHLSLLVGEGPKLLWEALRRGRFAQAMLVMDMLVPPLALLAGLLVVATLAQAIWALLTGWVAGLVLALLGVAALLVAIVAARHRFAAELIGLGELLKAPVYVLAKLPIYLSFVVRRQTEWVRTKRDH